VGVDEQFMTAVAGDKEIGQVNPRTGTLTGKRVKAARLFDLMTAAAWENGEPGILFFDHINNANSLPGCGPMRATNPCGEQPLLDYECCNLGSLNLLSYVIDTEGSYKQRIRWELLEEDICTAVRFLDNVIDSNYYPLPEIRDITLANRKIGLGVMGFADMLIALGIPYASKNALEVIDAVMGFIREKSIQASIMLGREKGNFPNIDKSIFRGQDRRNATLTTIAPTGTLSMLAGVSSGIEPLFGLSFVKEVLEGNRFIVHNRKFEEVAEQRGFLSRNLLDEIAVRGGLKGIKGIPEDIKGVFATAFEISPDWHVEVQAAFQKHVDNAVSKTVNFTNKAMLEDIKAVYLQAWKKGCKGITIYRMGSRENQVVRFSGKDSVGCLTCMD
jgi:ribonucleoside-diphosphate reductase alpha chain